MAPTLLFITGVLAGLIAGFILSRMFGRSRSGDGSGEIRLLEERLLKADQGLAQFSQQLDAQSSELRAAQQQAQQASEQAAVSRTQLEGVSQERDALKAGHDTALAAMDQLRREKEKLTATMAEVAEKLRSQESQTQFLEQARTDLLTQFRSLSGQMLDGSREALLKSTKETVSEPFAKEVLQLRQQVEALQKDSNAKLTVLAETTRDLRQRSEDVQGAAQQLTSALRSPNVKGQWGEMNLRRILEFVGLIAYCDFDEQVHVGTDEGAYRPDCVITIPGSRRLIVDSKAPIESYLDALQANDQTQRDAALTEHLKKVRSHIDLLSKKNYAGKLSALGQVVDGVVLFIPVEGALSMALERDPQLLEYAFSKNIILTFPTSLLAILKGLAMTIQQAEIAKNIDEIQAQAVELHKRFSTFIDKFNDIGNQLNRLNKSFNAAVGSAQSRLLPQGRRFAELAGQSGEIDVSDQIDEVVREIQAGE
ncbi:DNA recombination protein RmuC [Synechococcus sp. NOUM97013]|uniref:DNA recombination protein RmuC n=1 Tax=Synechococcus sp. NOUM97013 TaxID=1442555 RepID=UPI001860092E|nr:DNA recombination protein RmuC [Synechococcus sp. NOUM97013]QNI73795.1 RmuC family protein [Synechococcus sp. NOUM97013]